MFWGEEGVYVDDRSSYGAAGWPEQRTALANNATSHHVLKRFVTWEVDATCHVIQFQRPFDRSSVDLGYFSTGFIRIHHSKSKDIAKIAWSGYLCPFIAVALATMSTQQPLPCKSPNPKIPQAPAGMQIYSCK